MMRWTSPVSMVTVAVGLSLVVVMTGCTPDVTDIRNVGIKQYQAGLQIESMATFRRALDLAPNDAVSNYYMGLHYKNRADRKFFEGDLTGAYKQLDTAIMYFNQATTSIPNFIEAIKEKKDALARRGKYEQAVSMAEHVAQRIPGDKVTQYLILGNLYRDAGDADNALRAYKQALAMDPSSTEARVEIERLYEKARQPR
ncbi:MAG: tetratricopeptide repeat protein [Phycisphaerae bacterium]